jgi:hypothetical protein
MKKTILVIEPDHDARVEIRNMLEKEGYMVVSTALLGEISLPSLLLLSSSPALLHRDKFLTAVGANPYFNSIPVLHLLRTEDLRQILIADSF